MTREQFHHLVNYPSGIGEATAEQLPDLIRQFPYCQALRYLQLRYLSEKDSIHYPQQLKITSAYAPDRGRLYRIIHPEPELHLVTEDEPTPVETIQPIAAEVRVAELEPLPLEIDNPSVEETIGFQPEETLIQSLNEKLDQLGQWENASGNLDSASEPTEALIKPLVSPGLYIAPAETPEQVPDLPQPEAGADDLDRLIREELIQQELQSLQNLSSAGHKPQENREIDREKTVKKDSPKEVAPASPVTPDKKAIDRRPFAATLGKPEPESRVANQQREPIAEHRNETHSFSDWLRMGRSDSSNQAPQAPTESAPQAPIQGTGEPMNQPAGKPRLIFSKQSAQEPVHGQGVNPEIEIRPTSDLEGKDRRPDAKTERTNPVPAVSPDIPAEKFDYELLPPRKPIPDPSDVDTEIPRSQVPAKELIERFIQNEPRIHPSRSAFYSPVNMAKKSAQEEPDDLISETLARIHAEQGHFEKAISCYELLALKFPEKKRYFASLIDELKSKLNP